MNPPILRSARQIPMIGTYDVVVCGGGMAGVGAACAAARTGARTLLVERLETLGGLGSSGGVGNFCFGDDTLPDAHGRVFDDLWAGLSAYRAIGAEHGWRVGRTPPFFNHTFNHNVLPFVLQELAEDDGVDLLFATDVISAEVVDGAVCTAVLHNRSLCQRVAATVFIDCTGDGILSRHAGAEVLPPDPGHPQSIPPSHMLFVRRSEHPQPQIVRQAAPDAPPPKYSVWSEPDRIGLKMWWPGREFDTFSGRGYSEAGRTFRRRIPEFVRHFQGTEQGRDAVFDYSAPMFGLRDSVRIAGDAVLNENDLRSGRRFADAVAHGCFPLDSAALSKEPMPPYQIPYGCLCVRGLSNLLVAGRCFSATRIALSSARIMPTASLMGQAAGIAAAMAVGDGGRVRTVAPSAIRARLLDGARGGSLLAQRLAPAAPRPDVPGSEAADRCASAAPKPHGTTQP